ncbi:MAG: DegT/DnrJ/EryC1/StrS family aminotransferase, partial [Planctomycetaceae bacterium]
MLDRAGTDGSWGRYHGPHGDALTVRMAADLSVEHVVLCSSGTAAVELALRGLKVRPGDEVVLAAYDFKGNFTDVLTVGAAPVLVDVRGENWNLDPQQLDAAVTPSTKAIIVSHLHSGCVPMREVMDIAARHGVPVVEDACQMPGAVIDGRPAGTWGDVGVFSFGGSKLLSAGRGGAFFTNHAGIVQRARLYSHRGNEAYPLSELQAAVLLPQWEQLDERNARRRENAERLRELLAPIAGIEAFAEPPSDSQPGHYKFGLKYDAAAFDSLPRAAFAAAMRAEGVALDPGFRGLHRIHARRRFRA